MEGEGEQREREKERKKESGEGDILKERERGLLSASLIRQTLSVYLLTYLLTLSNS